MLYRMGQNTYNPHCSPYFAPRDMAKRVRKNSTPPSELPGGSLVIGTQDPDQPLTEMQREFVHQLVHNKLNQTAAARQAGFRQPGTAAHSLMRNPKVLKAIAEEREEYAKASGVTKKKVIDGMLEAIDMAKIKADPIAMISGWREVGRMCGFYEPTKHKVEVSVNGQLMMQRIQSMTDEELLALVEEDPNAIEGEFSVVEDPTEETPRSA